MRSLSLIMLEDYKTLIVKMEEDMIPIASEDVYARASYNFEFLVDVEMLLFPACIQS